MRLLSIVLLASIAACCAFGQNYTISTFAGGGLPVNVPGASASIGTVYGVAVDSSGNAFLTSTTLNVVLRLDAQTGILSLVAGNGTPGFSGDNGPAANAQLSDPGGIAVDSAGNVYIADIGNSRIRKISNGVITTVAGNGTFGYSGDNGPATSAQLTPGHGGCLAVDSLGNLYIADGPANRVRKVSNGVITTVVGNGTFGFAGDGGPATSAQLKSPDAVAVDSAGKLYIADTYNNRIREVSNGVITTVAGNGGGRFSGDNGPATSAQIGFPVAIAVDLAGNFYFSDSLGHIREVSSGVISTITAAAGAGNGIAVDSSGNLFIATGNSGAGLIEDSNGVITTVAGNGLINFSVANGPATSAQFGLPYGVAVDSARNVYISDQGNGSDGRVREVTNGMITTVAGGGASPAGNGPATSAQLDPSGVGVDSNGNLYLTDDMTYLVREVANGVITTIAGGGLHETDNVPATATILPNPTGVAVDSLGNIYIVDTLGISEVSNGVITNIAGAELNNPTGVAVDASGDVYIADSGNNRIREISKGVITTVAGTGEAGFSGDNGPATSAQLSNPSGVAVDSAGNIYIADQANNRIRKVSNGVITTLAGTGVASFSGDNGPAIDAELNGPSGIAVDYEGDVYVVDRKNLRVRVLTPSASSSCSYSVTPASLQVPAAGGAFSFPIQTTASCFWNVTGLPNWITVAGASLGNGLATVALVVAPNYSAAPLNASISIAGVSVAVTQQASTTTGPIIRAITNAASNLSGPIAPGEIVVLYGTGLGPAKLASLQIDSAGTVATQLAGTSVTFNGTPAPIIYTSANQVSAIVPYEVSGATAQVAVKYQGQTSTIATANVAPSVPALFTSNSSGQGPAAAVNQDGSYNDADHPAPLGSVITLYAIGEGQTSPAGGAPGEVAGIMQINAQIPSYLDPFSGGQVMIQVGSGASPPGVTVYFSY